MKCCPTCGQTLPDELSGVDLAPKEKRILQLITRAGEHGITADDLFNLVYQNERDGGPLTGVKTLHTIIHLLNRKLKKIKKKIENRQRVYVLRNYHRPNRKGETVLSADIAEHIRNLYQIRKPSGKRVWSQIALAKKYHVTQPSISVIVNHGAWATAKKAYANNKEVLQ